MMCHFCKQDVDQPCQTTQDVEQRAEKHIDRCENALKSQDGAASGT
jgi:hypothetical protein